MANTRKRKPFTPKARQELEGSKYVEAVHRTSIQFTVEFKELFCTQYEEGKTARQIFADCGINPDLLGTSRINNFSTSIRQHKAKYGYFEDRRALNGPHKGSRQQAGPPEEQQEADLPARVTALETELAYMKTLLEFVKKTAEADLEARRQWESSHRRRSSSS